ncbi:MAG: hypothetical protein IJV96_06800 [Clostridia bacterium]|nr:hypothetical protein [Clostridia bacterium]
MIEEDTIKLLRECDAGIKMGVASLEEVIPYTESERLREKLRECKEKHETLAKDVEEALARFGDDGKEPNPIAKGMSWMKTSVKMAWHKSDHTIADLMTDGCDMGVKSLSRYLNEYAAADEAAKDIAKRLIKLEADLAVDLREHL